MRLTEDQIALARTAGRYVEEPADAPLDALRALIPALDARAEHLAQVTARLEAEAALPTDRRATPDEQHRAQRAREDLQTLRDGLPSQSALLRSGAAVQAGLWDASLAAEAGQPGVDEVERLRSRVAKAVAAIEAYRAAWAAGPRRFRYVGRPGRAMWEGRLLERGEVVLLSETQAAAWADRFEPVEQAQIA